MPTWTRRPGARTATHGSMCLAMLLLAIATSRTAGAQDATSMPVQIDRSRDRGEGLPTSMFGTFIRRGELLVYPFFEHYRDRNFEYTPAELGAVGEEDYRGRYRASEGLVFLAYGISDALAVEFEVAVIDAWLDKSATDPSTLASRTSESGIGDIEGQIRWRWRRETDRRPEIFSYTELVVPHHSERVLVGTPGWEIKFGTGLVRGFNWGTLIARAAVEYDQASSSHFDGGEYAIEYLRRITRSWRLFAGVEGTQDEVSLIGEAQWHVTPSVYVKVNNGIGLDVQSHRLGA